MNSDQEWLDKGVEFKLVDEAMIPSVVELLDESFFPDEPLFRSLGMTLGNTSWLKQMYIDALKDGSSVVAVDKEGKLMGVRVGKVTRRADWGAWFEDRMTAAAASLPFLLPKKLKILMNFMGPAWLDFKPYKILSELPCEVMYDDKAVCSARWHGVKGLGTELVRRSEQVARDRGCTHTYAIVTGIYSAKIFDKLGHTLVKAVKYADFKDKHGELYLKDTREHDECKLYLKTL